MLDRNASIGSITRHLRLTLCHAPKKSGANITHAITDSFRSDSFGIYSWRLSITGVCPMLPAPRAYQFARRVQTVLAW
jgi:hypothetical protein